MKETINVSISGIAFTLDKECYVALSHLLNMTRNSTVDPQAAEQLVADVEANIAEQLLAAQSQDRVVSMWLLTPIIEQIAEQLSLSTSKLQSPTVVVPEEQSNAGHHVKRLLRNPNGALLGGVCTGLASYFNLDVVIFRILFLIPFLFGGMSLIWIRNIMSIGEGVTVSVNGTAILIYIVLWIVLPKPQTERERLQLQKANSAPSNGIFSSIAQVIAMIIAGSIFVGASIATVAFIIALSIAEQEGLPIAQALHILNIDYTMAVIWCSLLAMLPVLMICFAVFGSVFNFAGRRVVIGIMFFIWIVLIIWAVFLLAINAGELSTLNFDGHHHHNYGYDIF